VREEPVDVGGPVRVKQLAEKARELGRDSVLDRGVPLITHVEVPQNLPDGFEPVLHQSAASTELSCPREEMPSFGKSR
jgi:hypothetical protein